MKGNFSQCKKDRETYLKLMVLLQTWGWATYRLKLPDGQGTRSIARDEADEAKETAGC